MILTGAEPNEVWPLIRNFHYSKRMPTNIQHCYVARDIGGLFGDTGECRAAIIFGWTQAKWDEPILELTRLVKQDGLGFPLTKLISFALENLRKSDHDLILSYADWTQNHYGGIYQAASWNFHGKRNPANDGLIVNGKFIPGRSCNSLYGTRSAERLKEKRGDFEIIPHYDMGKFLYWKALNKNGIRRAEKLGLQSCPYPKPNGK